MSRQTKWAAQRVDKMYFSPVRKVMERAAQLKAASHPIISLSIGEPDFNSPSVIVEKTIEALQNNQTHYASNRGTIGLRTEISKYLNCHFNLDYDPESEILVTAGGAEAINNAFMAFVDPGDEVIVFEPAYMNYDNLITAAGGKMVNVPLRAEDAFQINSALFEEKITSHTKMVVVNNPCNPTGIVYTRETLEKLAEVCIRHDLLVFSDEIYNGILYDDVDFCPVASIRGMRERTITMNGFSKAFAMTGWRMGYLAAPPGVITDILKIHQYSVTCISTFSQIGAEKGMNAPETMVEMRKMVEAFEWRRNIILGYLDQMKGIRYIRPEGAFYIFVDVSGTGLDGDTFAHRLLEEKYVSCVPGSKLGKNYSKYIRISYATSDNLIQEAMVRLGEFVKGLTDV